MNPLIRLLMALARAQRHAPMQEGKSGMGSTPGAQNAMAQLDRSYYNPGGGTTGNDITGGGSVFGGFYRGQPLSSYYGVPSNVGNTSWLGGGRPGQYGSGFNQAPAWGAQNWLMQLLNSPNLNNPYPGLTQNPNNAGILNGGSLFAENQGPQFHGGGAGMLGFLRGGGSLASMDSLARGGSGGDSLGSPADGKYAE